MDKGMVEALLKKVIYSFMMVPGNKISKTVTTARIDSTILTSTKGRLNKENFMVRVK
jgi:hypothetical protein